ncbi:manganese efflux pump MntP [Anaerovorax odorimutans]|uniref:manganese efflux pump MntP n=1 Tax=Anaerovorax odorimutans TaxID=109327 RepID=UPI00041CFA95|nr:manganese efflux pump [Anaerovorax odorimutans]
MNILEIILIGIGLSMDAVAVSMTNGMVYKNMTKGKELAMPIAFGLFQGGMPLLGYFAGSLFTVFISKYSGIITLIILGFIGGKMIKDSFNDDQNNNNNISLTYKVLLFQALATSIDAFAVGVSFCATGVDINFAAPIIAITTFICSFLAIIIGKRFGNILGSKAHMLGGIILIIIGIKAII